MRTKLCVTVTGRTMAELRKRRDEVTDADVVELRLDTADDPDAAAALAGRKLPVIVTCRPVWEGGSFTGSEEARLRLLRDAQRLGAEYVDVEWRAAFNEIVQANRGRGVVLSMHDFEGVPSDLTERATAMRASGAQVIKLAAMAHRLTDCLPMLEAGRAATSPTIVISMGDAGLVSRVLATRFNTHWTYAGEGVAPGQVSAERLRRVFGFDRLNEATLVYGVVGRPIMHSLSPAMHNAAFQAASYNAVYLPLAAGDFDDFLAFAEALNVRGASVTAPFKLAAFQQAVVNDPVSRRIGAVNTLRRTERVWEGKNTDVAGFLAPLQRHTNVRGKRATVLGAGGAARAVVEALVSAGAHVAVSARDATQAQHVATLTAATPVSWPPRAGSWDILVNATPVGTMPNVNETPMPAAALTGELVYDLVYNPLDTRLLRESRRAGCQTLGGLDMLVAQAELQFEWWTGGPPRAGVMQMAAAETLASFDRSITSQ